jgi:hypothetical protein
MPGRFVEANARELPSRQERALELGYTCEMDSLSAEKWYELLPQFDDANIYQTWAYAEVISGPRKMSHLIVRHNGEVAAMALARLAKLPLVNRGVAYVRWAPLWRRNATAADLNTFRQAIRALRNEFVCKRRLSLRLFPLLFDGDSANFTAILEEEGFSASEKQASSRTILMDLTPPLDDLRTALARNWKRNLKHAEQDGLQVVEGSEDALFERVIDIYKQMVHRKNFLEPNDINQFRLMQAQLPEQLKMKIMLCKAGQDVCAGLVWSAIGSTVIELFAATSDTAVEARGRSHLLRWKLIEQSKENGVATFNLNGINPITNPGTYRFKADLAGKNGKDLHYLGRFDSHDRVISRWCLEWGDTLRMNYQSLKGLAKSMRGGKLRQISGVASTDKEGRGRSHQL